jgi:hypothetical protein
MGSSLQLLFDYLPLETGIGGENNDVSRGVIWNCIIRVDIGDERWRKLGGTNDKGDRPTETLESRSRQGVDGEVGTDVQT